MLATEPLKIPGRVGELVEHLCRLPGVDSGLAIGSALDLVARAAQGRCRIRAVPFGPENRGIDLWAPIRVRSGMLVDGESPLAMETRALRTTFCQNDARAEPGADDDFLLVPPTGQFTAAATPACERPPHLLAWLRDLRQEATARWLGVHIGEAGWHYGYQLALDWARQDVATLEARLRRTTGVAAYIALGLDRTITADVLVVARRIAVVEHEFMASMLESPNADGLAN